MALNMVDGQRYHRVDYHAESRLIGSLAGVIDHDTFISGYSAGFGGPDFLRDGERLDMVLGLVDHSLAELRAIGLRRVTIRVKPQHYSASEPYLHFALLRRGFRISSANINFYLPAGRYKSGESYVDALKSSARSELRYGLAAAYRWREAESEQDWETGFQVVVENQQSMHGSTTSLTFEYIERLRAALPWRLRLFQLCQEEASVAAALIYTITRGRWQVMFWGDNHRGDFPSPMNAVAYYIVISALENGVKTIDLGPSTSDTNINYGGVSFKKHIGALPDMRYIMTIDL